MLRPFRQYIDLVLVLAFVLSGISPACKFISGEHGKAATGFIEICTSAGLETIAVPGAENPQTRDAPSSSGHEDQTVALSDCLFCFATAHAKAVAARDFNEAVPHLHEQQFRLIPAGRITPRRLTDNYSPRAPPTFS